MTKIQKSSPLLSAHLSKLSEEDWIIIDEALNRIARSLRKIEKEEQAKKLKADESPLQANQ